MIEQIRRYHCQQEGLEFQPIPTSDPDCRANRLTAYLNLLDQLVAKQVADLHTQPFTPESNITRYYELLPDSPLKSEYEKMKATDDAKEKSDLQEKLRQAAVPGNIDVNIMTKVDTPHYNSDGEQLPTEFNDAMAALRGFAQSTLNSSLVISAGMHPVFYSYAAQFKDFFPSADGPAKKKIILKVSDFRSALIQGKFLAKRGLWVTEYRVESGLNCGGHTFATKGHLMGPILEEFKTDRSKLEETVFNIYKKAVVKQGHDCPAAPPEMLITVQGGIGTADEDQLCRKHYNMDGTGWGTPFLLVPEVSNVDPEHLDKLSKAGEKDVKMGGGSPLGVPFWALRTSKGEIKRRKRIEEGSPGSKCPKGYLRQNLEFGKPLCTASFEYQKQKLQELENKEASSDWKAEIRKIILAKACICHDLAGSVTQKLGLTKNATPAICSGPGIANFAKIASLEEMVGHIYGRLSLLTNPDRPHFFISELKLYVEYLRKEAEKVSHEISNATPRYFQEFHKNLLCGIDHYKQLAEQFVEDKKGKFLKDLSVLREEVEKLRSICPM